MNELKLRSAAPDTIELLDSAVAEVFDLMLGKTCSPVCSRVDFVASLTVTIRLSGQMNGTCWLGLSPSAATKAMEAMLGGDIEDNSMVEDTAKELCNVIVGSWKSKLPPPQASAKLSLPIATYGEDSAGRKKRLYSFDGNLLALALSIRKGERNYLTTDWNSGELSSDANWLSDEE
jgi:CheY-specific phosphatase CheX